MIRKLLPAVIALLGALVWAVSHASAPVRWLTWALVAIVDVAGLVVVWRAAKVEGHRTPARAARLFSLSWLAVLGWGATVTAVVAWLGELGGAALDRDRGASGMTVAALVAFGAAVAGVVGDVAAGWMPDGVARTSISRVYGPRFPRLAADGSDPPAYLDAYRAVWDDPALLVDGDVVQGWDVAARARRLELIAAGLADADEVDPR